MDFVFRSSCIHTKVGEVDKCIRAAFHQKGESVEQLRSNTRHKTVTLLGKSRPDKNDHRQFSIHLGEIAPFPLVSLGSVVNKIFI